MQALEEVDLRKSDMEEGELIEIRSEKTTLVASELEPEVKANLIACLWRNTKVFTKDVHDLIGITSNIVEHHLNINQGTQPVKQRKRYFGTKKDRIMTEEVKKLLEVDILRKFNFLNSRASGVCV